MRQRQHTVAVGLVYGSLSALCFSSLLGVYGFAPRAFFSANNVAREYDASRTNLGMVLSEPPALSEQTKVAAARVTADPMQQKRKPLMNKSKNASKQSESQKRTAKQVSSRKQTSKQSTALKPAPKTPTMSPGKATNKSNKKNNEGNRENKKKVRVKNSEGSKLGKGQKRVIAKENTTATSKAKPAKNNTGQLSNTAKKSLPNKKNKKPKLLPLQDIVVGSPMNGKVVALCSFGAFVQTKYAIKGAHYGCALLHISQIKDRKIDDINDVLKIGQLVENAKFTEVDVEKGEVRISTRTKNKGRTLLKNVKVGRKVEGKIVGVAEYGAFVDVGCKVSALLHKSKTPDGTTEHMKVGQFVNVHITQVDTQKKNMACSMLEPEAIENVNKTSQQSVKKLVDKEMKDYMDNDDGYILDNDNGTEWMRMQLNICDMIESLEESM